MNKRFTLYNHEGHVVFRSKPEPIHSFRGSFTLSCILVFLIGFMVVANV